MLSRFCLAVLLALRDHSLRTGRRPVRMIVPCPAARSIRSRASSAGLPDRLGQQVVVDTVVARRARSSAPSSPPARRPTATRS